MSTVWTSIFTATPWHSYRSEGTQPFALGKWGPMVALELDVLKAAYDGQVHHLVCHKGWRHCEKNRRTMEHEHPHHSIDAYKFSWFAQQILASFIDVIFSFHCLGYSWRHSILTSRKYKTLTIRLKKTVSWRAKTLTMSAPDFTSSTCRTRTFFTSWNCLKICCSGPVYHRVEVQSKHSNCWNWYLHPWLQG